MKDYYSFTMNLVNYSTTNITPQQNGGFFWSDITLTDIVLKKNGMEYRFKGKVFSPVTIFDLNYYGKK